MGDNDKPFACSEAGCNMKFANEDHLNVHRMKHQMSLTLTPGTGKLFSFSLADQTPTPTKFLKNCDEIGLFNELTVPKNPFDDAFKQATDEVKVGKKTLTIPSVASTSDNDVLNTPQPKFLQEGCPSPDVPTAPPLPEKGVVLLDDPPTVPTPPALGPLPDQTDHQTNDDMQDSPVCLVVTESPLPGPPKDIGSTVTIAAPEDEEPLTKRRRSHLDSAASSQSSQGPMEVVVEEHVEYIEEPLGAAGDVSSVMLNSGVSPVAAPSPPQPGSRVTPVVLSPAPAPVVTPLSIATSPEATVLGQQPLEQPQQTKQTKQQQPAANVLGLPKIASVAGAPQYVIQVMVQTPNGETMPVHIPAHSMQPLTSGGVQQAPKVTTGGRQTSSSQDLVSSTTGGAANASTLTKRKLKETLQQNIQQNIFTSNMRVMTEAVDRVTATQPTQNTQNKGRIAKSLSILNPSVVHPPKQEMVEVIDADTSSNSSSHDDSEDRRQKFLERNRAAAARCRQKKKQWVGNLEQKADELTSHNTKLQTEISSLKAEVANLKMLLLAHKDCPVTRQQQLNGQLSMVVTPPEEPQYATVVQNNNITTSSISQPTITTRPTIVTKLEPNQDIKPIIISMGGTLPTSLEPINLKITPNT